MKNSSSKKQKSRLKRQLFEDGGRREIRTPDPLGVNEVL
ncbi:hypothetical protein MTBPR1_10234 [Candidatus Terasakiella magnetica]|uniref:Uncharacterized protein n=1 Tax=Candidatus Terasakiella magnetica TaxID=1867952 RepID=A0A1C3RCI2_9PROT|nr:hypothetical protein MTBPR1_10234 [Candidatus Terasakiella magnetica]